MIHTGHSFSLEDHRFRFIVALIFLFMFILGFSVSGDYGVAYDEPTEINILQMNIREVAETVYSADSALVYKFQNLGIGGISSSIERDHGQAAYYPFALRLLRDDVLNGEYEYADIARPYHFYTFTICFSAVIALYFIVKELFGSRQIALLCAVIFYISPRYFAESHYNNKDIVLLCLLLDTSLFGIRAIKRRNLYDVLIFSLAAALTANTKVIGLFFFAIIGLTYLLYISANRLWNGHSIAMAILAIASFCLFYYALTPAMWHNPAEFFEYSLINAFKFSRWRGSVLFEGALFRADLLELPRRYLPKLIFISTPLFILLLAIIGIVRIAVVLCRKDLRKEFQMQIYFVLMICFCAFLPLLVAIVKRTVVYNGWRHFYFCYAGIIILMVFGLEYLLHRWHKATTILISIFILILSVQNVLNHPYQYTYYNCLAGKNIEQNYEMDYWTVSMKNALELVASEDKRDISVSCFTWSTDQLKWSVLLLDKDDRARIKIYDQPEFADYLIENSTYQHIQGDPKVPPGFHYMTSLYSYGSPIVNIYCR